MAETEDWQRSLNRQTEGQWASYTSHRQHVTELLSGRAEGLRLCVLGAGNCNDIDLSQLVPRFRRIVLVDVDIESVKRAAQRQPVAVQRVLELRAPVDFSALSELASGSTERAVSTLALAKRLAGTIDAEPFDIVASTCVLSQLVDQVRAQLSGEPERCLVVVQRVREVHLALVLQLLRPGGRGVLFSDMVSSDTAPELIRSAPGELPALMAKLVAAKNFFTGVNPFVIEASLKQHPTLAPLVARTAFHRPWIWQLTPARAYLTFALSCQRR